MEKHRITSDGVHRITRKNSTDTSIVAISGAFGSATAVLSYVDADGNAVAYTDGTTAIGGQYRIQHGFGSPLFLNVNSSNGSTDILVEVRPAN